PPPPNFSGIRAGPSDQAVTALGFVPSVKPIRLTAENRFPIVGQAKGLLARKGVPGRVQRSGRSDAVPGRLAAPRAGCCPLRNSRKQDREPRRRFPQTFEP